MSKVPRAHEIFHNPVLGKTSVFQYNEQESMQKLKLTSKKSATPASGMKKFGGYKPKILGGQSDFLALQQDTESTNESPVVGSDASSPTKPKPWVVGDKNVPMVLGPLDDDDDDDYVDENGNNPEMYFNGFGRVNDLKDIDDVKDIDETFQARSISSETSTLVSQHSDDLRHGLANAAYVSSSVSDMGSTDHLPADDRPAPEPSGVFIPAPDYDEEERTLDFNSEDTDEGEDHQRAHPQRTKPVMKVYDGEDLSRYLSDDDDEVDSEVQLRHNGKSHKGTVNGQLNPKHSIFKPSQTKSKKTRGGTQGSSSVRSFSYADSKFGTKGKASSKSLVAETPDDSQRFLTANTHQSSYESFLRSRNGDVLPSLELNDSGVDMGEEFSRDKDDTLWKKMTLRLKHRLSKSMKDH